MPEEHHEVREKLTSQFNGAVSQLMRLDAMFQAARSNREKGNLLDLRWVLDSIEVELSCDISRVEEGKYRQELHKINKLTDLTFIKGFPRARYNLLILKEKLLRKIQDTAGKGSKLIDEDDEGM